MNEEILAYLRQNRHLYTREALTLTLNEAGHEPSAVEAAWQDLEAVAWPPPLANGRAPAGVGPGTTVAVVLLALLVSAAYGAAIYLAVLGIVLVASFESDRVFLFGLYAIAMLIGAIFSLVKLARAPSTGRGAAAVAGAFAISFVIFVGLSGACFVGMGALQPR